MRIAVIGAGAMGSVYGGLLSVHDDVTLIDTNKALVNHINSEGLCIAYKGEDRIYHPRATVSSEGIDPVDLIIVFVKSPYTDAALSAAKGLIGPDTYLMSLQNGGGHDEDLLKYTDSAHAILGTTEDNGHVLGLGHIARGGEGRTNIGTAGIDGDFIAKLSSSLSAAGFTPILHDSVSALIWEKLTVNASLSALTAVLASDMSFIASCPDAWTLCQALIDEVTLAAESEGVKLDPEKAKENVKNVSLSNPGGITSIAADISSGRKTECDYISGYVVRTAEKHGIPVPHQDSVYRILRALEAEKPR